MPTKEKTIKKELSKGRQSMNYDEFLKLDGLKLKISIKSDSYDFQCHARILVWSEQDLKWNLIDSIPFANMMSFDLDQYVTDKSLDGLFYMLAQEEAKIRQNPSARVTGLLQEVFGSTGK